MKFCVCAHTRTSCPWGEAQSVHRVLRGLANPLEFADRLSRGEMQWSLWPGSHLGPVWPSPRPSLLLKNTMKLRILVPAALGFVGFSPPAAESVPSSSADQACFSLLRHQPCHCDLKVVVSSHSFHSNSHDSFWNELLDTVSPPENIPNRNVPFHTELGFDKPLWNEVPRKMSHTFVLLTIKVHYLSACKQENSSSREQSISP